MAMSLNVTLNDDVKQKHLFMIMIIFNTYLFFYNLHILDKCEGHI